MTVLLLSWHLHPLRLVTDPKTGQKLILGPAADIKSSKQRSGVYIGGPAPQMFGTTLTPGTTPVPAVAPKGYSQQQYMQPAQPVHPVQYDAQYNQQYTSQTGGWSGPVAQGGAGQPCKIEVDQQPGLTSPYDQLYQQQSQQQQSQGLACNVSAQHIQPDLAFSTQGAAMPPPLGTSIAPLARPESGAQAPVASPNAAAAGAAGANLLTGDMSQPTGAANDQSATLVSSSQGLHAGQPEQALNHQFSYSFQQLLEMELDLAP